MKKIFLTMVLGILSVFTFAQIKISSTGNVGINNLSPTYNLDVLGNTQFKGTIRFQTTGCTYNDVLLFDNTGYLCKPTIRPALDWSGHLGTASYRFGDVFAHHVVTYNLTIDSDEKIKTNIKPLENTLDKIKKIKSVSYNLKDEYSKNPNETNTNITSKDEIGFLAQNLLETYPELVIKRDDIGHYTVNYIGMIPVLLDAIKEQQVEIEELKLVVQKIASSSKVNIESSLGKAELFQNSPNPFNKETEIKFNLVSNFSESNIIIYDLNGKQIKKYSILNRDQKSINISSNELYPGMFYYSLVMDGVEINTKKMIVTE